jgi:hypothetical protein
MLFVNVDVLSISPTGLMLVCVCMYVCMYTYSYAVVLCQFDFAPNVSGKLFNSGKRWESKTFSLSLSLSLSHTHTHTHTHANTGPGALVCGSVESSHAAPPSYRACVCVCVCVCARARAFVCVCGRLRQCQCLL